MKAAIIGSGLIAGTHVNALRAAGVTPALVVSRTKDGAERFAKMMDIPAWSDAISSVFGAEIDCVHLCTPPAQHAEQALRLLAAGRNLITEKPLCLTGGEGRQLDIAARIAAERGVTAATCFNVRFYPAVRELRRRIADGEIGDILHAQGSYLQQFHLPPHEWSWRFDEERAGRLRAITEIGTHWFDLLRFLTGAEVRGVCAEVRDYFPTRYRHGDALNLDPTDGTPIHTDSEDAAAVLLRLSGGAMASVMLSECAAGHGNALSIELCGTKGALGWCEDAPDVLRVGTARGAFKEESYPVESREDTFTALFTEVYAAISARRAAGVKSAADSVKAKNPETAESDAAKAAEASATGAAGASAAVDTEPNATAMQAEKPVAPGKEAEAAGMAFPTFADGARAAAVCEAAARSAAAGKWERLL